LYSFQNKVMEEAGKKDKALEIKLATRIKRNANTLKNYQGKLKGLSSLQLVAQKKQEDAALAQFINSNVALKQKYGSLMLDIDKLYNQVYSDAYQDMWLGQIYASTSLMNIARQINNFKRTMAAQPAASRLVFYTDNIGKLEQSLKNLYNSYDLNVDKTILKRMVSYASAFPQNQRIKAVDEQLSKGFDKKEQVNNFVESRVQYTKLKDQDYTLNKLLKSQKTFNEYNDPLLNFEKEISDEAAQLKEEKDRRNGLLNKLMGDYVAVKEKFLKKDFIPDANSTLRLTYGYVRGYSPADALYMKPFTSIKGIIEKGSTGNPEYAYPPQIKDLWLAKDFGIFAKKDINDVPVGLLYDMDTTGGNSGSPIMDANGELIGVNFDRAYGATINDYAWNPDYSRSIGVDIRFVLWAASKIDKADFLLKEMGI
ncbi:MAG: S46 family peptidase, partial [Sphingobacteriaceae bacterium]|nr:S46 family peptidase [Sphingobacteriaceae bacterium]